MLFRSDPPRWRSRRPAGSLHGADTARRPAILVETGFATNRTDGAFLASSLGQHKIASAIADGIVAYLLEFERKLAIAAPARGR